MVTLALVRHAKSDWGAPDLDDHDRPLNSRGMREAKQMADRLAETGFSPERILASTARRARTTADFFGAALGRAPELREELYSAPSATILAVASAGGVPSVLVVAHDPGMSDAVERISDGEWSQMPTAAVAVFGWDTDDWDVALATPPDTRSFDTPR